MMNDSIQIFVDIIGYMFLISIVLVTMLWIIYGRYYAIRNISLEHNTEKITIAYCENCKRVALPERKVVYLDEIEKFVVPCSWGNKVMGKYFCPECKNKLLDIENMKSMLDKEQRLL